MARSADHVRPSDVTFWGVVALVCCGAAVLSANVSALVPSGLFAGLHTSRADGGTIGQLRSQVLALGDETTRLRRENAVLQQRFTLAEQARGEVTRRVGALEVSLPELLEQQAAGPGIDRSVTASIDEAPARTFATDGGTVAVSHKPLPPSQPIPEATATVAAPTADAEAFAVTLGFPVGTGEAQPKWQEYSARVGTLLLGLAPLLQPTAEGSGHHLVAGPLATSAQAEALCGRLDLVGIPCDATHFTGEPLPPPN